jgi:uncharacterized membrane protein
VSKKGPPPAESAGDAGAIILRPNRSLSARGMAALFGGLGASAIVIGALFLSSGAWPVLPFLALEVAAVGLTLLLLYRHADDCEVIRLEDDRLEVVQRRGRIETCHRFSRYWARVAIEPASNAHHPSRLLIRSHGRELEVGAGMTEEARRVLAGLLSGALGSPSHREARRSPRGSVTLSN